MRKTIVIIAAVSVCLCACSKKEQNVSENTSVRTVYIQAKSADTKSNIDGTSGAFSWSVGDQIAVYTSGGYKKSDALVAGDIAGSKASFGFSGANAFDEADRADFAVYPASMVFDELDAVRSGSASNHSAASLTITLPASYTRAQAENDASPWPMIATNAPDGELAFRALCALLRITVNNISKDADHIAISFPGQKVQGEFVLASAVPGTISVVAEASAVSGDDAITITDLGISEFTSGLVLNVPVPAGTYTDVKVTAYDADNHVIHAITTPIINASTSWNPVRTKARRASATLPVFSVSASKKVVFAPGNLQAVIATAPVDNSAPGTAESWKFAEKQYDCVGRGTTAADGGTNHANMAAGTTIDLFCFVGASATYNSYGIVLTNDNNGSFVGNVASELMKSDFGENVIDGYPANTWETQLSSEWGYVLNTRTASTLNGKANARYVRVMISGVPTFYNATAGTSWKAAPFTDRYGIILFPDAYEHPSGVPLPAANINVATVKWDGTGDPAIIEYSVSQWEKLEAAGCVFLPTAGIRQYNSGKWQIGQLNAWAYYLSKTGGAATTVYKLAGQPAEIYYSASARNVASAVRLQRQVN